VTVEGEKLNEEEKLKGRRGKEKRMKNKREKWS